MRNGALLLLAAMALAGNEPKQWVFFESRETSDPPLLEIEFAGGASRILTADADSMLISYLADRSWGRHPNLSLSLGDTNRVLIRFDDLPDPATVEKAELVLSLKLSEVPPQEPFRIALHRVASGWDEGGATWSRAPRAHDPHDLVLEVEPKEQLLRIDVTESLKKGAAHGWLIKVPGALRKLEEFILDALEWEESVGAALQKAREKNKRVLALVTCPQPQPKPGFGETLLIATALAHPEVRALIRERYVCVRTGYAGNEYTARIGPDLLQNLGTKTADAKAPALVVATGSGKHVATLEAIGTYDYGIVLQFLGGKLKPHPGVAAMRKGEFERAEALLRAADTDDARYWLGALQHRKHRRDEAEKLWSAVKKDSPWWLKCQARLQWSYALATGECLKAPAWKPPMRSTEVALKRTDAAVRYLIESQQPDGSWETADRVAMYHAAVTALCARALLPHAEAREAVEKATAWLRKYAQGKDPADANAWSADYTLDFFLDRFEADQSFQKDAQKAVELVSGGQGPKGAWSYSKNWGANWKGGFASWPKTEKGRYHSMNTGPSLVSLARAKKLGLPVDAKVLRRGAEALMRMRDEPGVFTYTWPEPRNFNRPDASIARAPACEQALFMLEATKKKDLKTTMGYFLKYREDLRKPAKLTAGWTAPRGYSGYFFHFAYFHAAEAFRLLGDKRALKSLQKDLLAVAEADGTWTDWQNGGKPYATAMALLVLR
jgi:hypothetical protein